QEAGDHGLDELHWPIDRRMIHTSADFEYIRSTRVHPDAVEKGIRAIQRGESIITDTAMAMAGIRKKTAEAFGCRVECLISRPDVVRAAREKDRTRAEAAVDAAEESVDNGIFVVGNAPTALMRLLQLVREKKAAPSLILGFPVGFVNAAESKEALLSFDVPFITNTGRKGGSNTAAAVVNALLIMAEERKRS
ncbi:MAG: precorrin-8X methylmutase, partial [Desulfarculaceae bacterium]|nr:precorrin-8X methylmutase [Desulfarculaceae bacterium]